MYRKTRSSTFEPLALDASVAARAVSHCAALLPKADLLLAGLLLRLRRSRCAMN
jgi:hypothetical protein